MNVTGLCYWQEKSIIEFIRLLLWGKCDCADAKGEKQLTGKMALYKCHKSNSNNYKSNFTLSELIIISLLPVFSRDLTGKINEEKQRRQ